MVRGTALRYGALTVLALALAVGRSAISVEGYESRDGIYFARGVVRYALLERRPHWPGYPVYIWLGRLAVGLAGGDTSRGLHALSALATGLTVLPLACIAARMARTTGTPAAPAAFLAAALWTTSPLAWVVGSEVLTEPVALLFLSWSVALGLAGRATPHRAAGLGVLGGLAVGCRPPFVELLPAVAMAHPSWGQAADRRRLIGASVLAFAAVCTVWMAWQLHADGVSGYLQAAQGALLGFAFQHGGNVVTDPGLVRRLLRVVGTTFGHGFAAWLPGRSWPSWVVAGVLAVGLCRAGARLRCARDRTPWRVAMVWLLGYGVLVLLVQDPDYVRYELPLVAVLAAVLPCALPREARLATATATGVGILIAMTAAPLIAAHL